MKTLHKRADALKKQIKVQDSPWDTGVNYTVGDRVTHVGKLWECTMAHLSQTIWCPGASGVYLWQEVVR